MVSRSAEVSATPWVAVVVRTSWTNTAASPHRRTTAPLLSQETTRQPVLSTTGGTSDARFVKDHCPVVEFGLVGAHMHQVDERVPAQQVRQLQVIYQRILERFFA